MYNGLQIYSKCFQWRNDMINRQAFLYCSGMNGWSGKETGVSCLYNLVLRYSIVLQEEDSYYLCTTPYSILPWDLPRNHPACVLNRQFPERLFFGQAKNSMMNFPL